MVDKLWKSEAVFSEDRAYRYRLSRVWNESLNYALFIMLNPSTADEVQNDPTIERCQTRAIKMGYGGLVVANIFALRGTDPNVLYGHPDPNGPENDLHILDLAKDKKAGIVICGWGEHGRLNGRGDAVMNMLRIHGVDPYVFKLNLNGSPAHPLYLSYNLMPQRFIDLKS